MKTTSKILVFGIAMIAMFITSAGTVQADAPNVVVQASGDDTESAEIQQVGHDACATSCNTGCSGAGCNGNCDKCRRMGLLERIRYFGLFPNRCRDGLFNGGLSSGLGACRDGLGDSFAHRGCGGKGCPPFGRYQMVYPLNPEYFDGRDGQVHAAQGYGVPMGVPLAPVVRQQYNYSWGVPASRITPISNHNPHSMMGYPGYGYGYGYGYAEPGMSGGYYGSAPGNCPHCQAGQPMLAPEPMIAE